MNAAARALGYSSAAEYQNAINNPSTPPVKMAPTGPPAGTAPVMSLAAAQAMGQGLSTMPTTGASNTAMTNWVSGMNAYTPPAAQPAAPAQPVVNPYAKQLADADAQLTQYQNTLAAMQRQQYTTPVTPTAASPVTAPVSTTGVQTAAQENPNLGIPKGPAGFTFSGVAPGASALPQVSPDATYNLWKQLNGGKENPQMQQYFKSGDWLSVAAGNIPQWMGADNTWRAFLMRLGYMKPSYNQDYQDAIQKALANAQQTTPATT